MSQRAEEKVIEIVDEAPEEPTVIQPRKSSVRPTSSGSGPSSVAKPRKKPGIFPAKDVEISDFDEDLDECSKNRAEAETAEELKSMGSFSVGTTPGRETKSSDAHSTLGYSKRRGDATIVKKTVETILESAKSDEEVGNPPSLVHAKLHRRVLTSASLNEYRK